MKNLIIHSNIRDYEVIFENDFNFLDEYKKAVNRFFIIDEKVYKIYKNRLFQDLSAADYYLFDAKEDNKNLTTVTTIYDRLLKLAVKRKLTVIAIGGGIMQDVAGFVCSTIYRGVKWISVPTTLLAQVDSCIGSKTSLNYKSFKNILGTFYPPQKVHLVTQFLESLSEQDIYCGLGEIVKLQLMAAKSKEELKPIAHKIQLTKKFIKDKRIDLSNLLSSSLGIKKQYIEADEFDLGVRNLLNFGHEFGHALESASNFQIPHGIAVVVGIIFANVIAVERGLLSDSLAREINQELLLPIVRAGKDTIDKQHFLNNRLLSCMQNDKKSESAKLVVVIQQDDFKLTKLIDVTKQEFDHSLTKLKTILFG